MSTKLVRTLSVATLLVLAVSRTAHADPPPPATPLTPAAPPTPSLHWGWVVAIASLAAGTSLTVVSLTLQCPEGDIECARWTSFGIWGGIGIASIGAAAGLAGVTVDSRRAHLRVSIAVDRAPRAVLIYSF